jgi:hypothetical protein
VIASCIFVDAGCSANFAPGNDCDIFVHTAFVDVFNEGRETLIELRQVRVLEAVEVIGVEIPTPEVKT